MKSIGFVVLDRDGDLVRNIGDLEIERSVELINAAPNTFGMEDKCPLRVVEAFINED